MGTHWIIFLDIGNLVSPPSFPFAGQVKGKLARPLRTIYLSVLGSSSRAVKPWGTCCLARVTCETRCLLIGGASNSHVTNGLGDRRFRWSRDRFVAQFLFSSNPVLDIFSVFAAALKIQLMSPATDLFSRWFSESNHCNLLVLLSGRGRSSYRPPYMRRGLLAVRGDADLYLLRLRLLALRHMQALDPIAILGPNALGADCVRSCAAPCEATIGAF